MGSKGGLRANNVMGSSFLQNIRCMSYVLVFYVLNHEYRLQVYIFQGRNSSGPFRGVSGAPKGRQNDRQQIRAKYHLYEQCFGFFSLIIMMIGCRYTSFKEKVVLGPLGSYQGAPRVEYSSKISIPRVMFWVYSVEP